MPACASSSSSRMSEMPWNVTGLPASDPASTGTPARIAFGGLLQRSRERARHRGRHLAFAQHRRERRFRIEQRLHDLRHRETANVSIGAVQRVALPRPVEDHERRREGDLLRRHQRDRLVGQAARGVLDAVGARVDRQPHIRVGADMNGGAHAARLRFGHRREKHLVAQPRQRPRFEARVRAPA